MNEKNYFTLLLIAPPLTHHSSMPLERIPAHGFSLEAEEGRVGRRVEHVSTVLDFQRAHGDLFPSRLTWSTGIVGSSIVCMHEGC